MLIMISMSRLCAKYKFLKLNKLQLSDTESTEFLHKQLLKVRNDTINIFMSKEGYGKYTAWVGLYDFNFTSVV